jgi:hypothetical protein
MKLGIIGIFAIATVCILVLIISVCRMLCSYKRKGERFEEVEHLDHDQKGEDHPETEEDIDGNLHTARGGITKA